MEAYVDDMMVESVKGDNHIEDLRKTFETMCLHKVRLNPVKCNFGIQHAKFWATWSSKKRNWGQPWKQEVIEGMRSPTYQREVQSLNGRLVALNRFLAKSGSKSLPFFQVMRVNRKFEWTPDCQPKGIPGPETTPQDIRATGQAS